MPRKAPASRTKKPSRPAKRSPITTDKRSLQRDPLVEYRAALGPKAGEGDVAVRVEPLTGEVLSKVRMWLPTGILGLDTLLGGRGLPCGRVVELYGPNHIGKSTILDHMFAAAQRRLGYGLLVDTEAARDIEYTRALGVDVEKLQVIEFERGELTVEHIVNKVFASIDWWRTNYPESPVVIGWDSLGGTATNEELTKQVGDPTMASAAKVMRQACRQVAGRIGNSAVVLVICNHEYEKIGQHFGVGSKKSTYGGEALRHAASIRIELYNAGAIKRADGTLVGREVGLKLGKNRLGPPGECRLAILHGLGVDNTWTIYQELLRVGYLQQARAGWTTLNLDGQELKVQGWSGLRAKIAEDPALFDRLLAAYQSVVKPPVVPTE